MRSFSTFLRLRRELGMNRLVYQLAGTASGSRAEDGDADAEALPDADVIGAGPITPVSTTLKGNTAVDTKRSTAVAGTRTSAQSPPLTHEQLPDESIYILDGTSMLFRAFYGRGAGG